MFLCVLMEKFICVGNILLKRVARRSAVTPGYLMPTWRQPSGVHAITHGLVRRLYLRLILETLRAFKAH